MTDFFNNITSIGWWIGVVIVGILLNVAAMYLKSPIDRLVGSISTKYQTRSKAKKAEREAKIVNLVGNKHEQILHASDINFALGTCIFQVVSGVTLMIMVGLMIILKNLIPEKVNILQFRIISIGAILLGALSIFRGLSKLTEARDNQKILKEAKERESKLEGSN